MAIELTSTSVSRVNPFKGNYIYSGWLFPSGEFRWANGIGDHEKLAKFLGYGGIEDLQTKTGSTRIWADGDDKIITIGVDRFAELPPKSQSAIKNMAIEYRAAVRDDRGNYVIDHRDDNVQYEGTILLKSILLETQVPVVVGRIGMQGDIQSTESKKSHSELGFQRGKCWRYNPYNKTLYWHGDESEHGREDEIQVEDHLIRKYNYTVKRQITLEASEDEYNMADAFPGHFNKSHGYMTETLSSVSSGYSGYMGGFTKGGEPVGKPVENVIETDHSEISAWSKRWRWARGAPDTIMWTETSDSLHNEDFKSYSNYISDWLEHKTGHEIGRHRFFPEGYSTWSDRVHQSAGKNYT